jgi:hypothetical protein
MEQSSAVELTPEHYYNYYYAYEEDGSGKDDTEPVDSTVEDSDD